MTKHRAKPNRDEVRMSFIKVYVNTIQRTRNGWYVATSLADGMAHDLDEALREAMIAHYEAEGNGVEEGDW